MCVCNICDHETGSAVGYGSNIGFCLHSLQIESVNFVGEVVSVQSIGAVNRGCFVEFYVLLPMHPCIICFK